jgi:hypothetical protein
VVIYVCIGYCIYVLHAFEGVSEGTWYFEVDIKDMSQAGCAVRLGWAQVYGMEYSC